MNLIVGPSCGGFFHLDELSAKRMQKRKLKKMYQSARLLKLFFLNPTKVWGVHPAK